MSRSAVVLILLVAGCDQAMSVQPKRRPLAESRFFEDGRSSRPPVAGTIAQGQLKLDPHLYRGLIGTEPADSFPFPMTREILERGRQRYDIFCSPCHDRTGSGQGRIVARGFRAPPSYHLDRLRQAKPGQLFDVITRGFGAMQGYGDEIPARDRWDIVAWIRVLQETRVASLGDLPSDERKRLEAEPP